MSFSNPVFLLVCGFALLLPGLITAALMYAQARRQMKEEEGKTT
ncbi:MULTISPECIES: hypothetical protein [Streptomyces]|jgi:UPF0716 family protein affecting phage T7 exclusion|uniref:Uncharacterized protein n=1 Tax=Streptomyces bottropensis ATCC 25435 TaxID=1054862 RepID=M3G096_9ACTN|nr:MULTISPECIES: hypothetical protein [Streptomyces]EMF57989.1 hypothetical protein SBD_0661 [Streptomyces bottropensis ATCC 25435]WSG27619.1 hypothetical protein OHB30_45540 [Streptomyces europaeiscabiei]